MFLYTNSRYRLEIMNLHRLLQESREQIDNFQRSLNILIEENMNLQKKIDELTLQNVLYFTDFYEFRSKYDQIVQEMLEKIMDVKENLLKEDRNITMPLSESEAMKKIEELLYMINLVQMKENNVRQTMEESLVIK